MGNFDEVGFDEPPMPRYGHNQRQQDNDDGMGFDMASMFGKKPKQEMKSNVKQYTHRGKSMVEDPENPDQLIKLSTYKKRYGKTTQPKKQMRNNAGRQSQNDMGIAFGEMKETYQVAKKVTGVVREKLRSEMVPMMEIESQPDAPQNMKTPKQSSVQYSVDVTFDDGSTTQIITPSLAEAKSKQSSMRSDPSVKSAELNYL